MAKTNPFFLILLTAVLMLNCKTADTKTAYSSEQLKIIPLSDHSFIHISYLETQDFGRVACNGLIYMNDGEAVVFDTPVDSLAAGELIQWITDDKKQQLKGVVINHFHGDCLGSLESFHVLGIPSYASAKTLMLTEENGLTKPQIGFEKEMDLQVGRAVIKNRFFGEAHTVDNIASYIPEEQLLFGGCPVKSIGASKGYLGDANVETWSKTITKIKAAYPGLQLVVPGHGAPGDTELLDYTIQLFSN